MNKTKLDTGDFFKCDFTGMNQSTRTDYFMASKYLNK